MFDPFPELLAWGREIDEGDLPVEMQIDEEGLIAVLTVLRLSKCRIFDPGNEAGREIQGRDLRDAEPRGLSGFSQRRIPRRGLAEGVQRVQGGGAE